MGARRALDGLDLHPHLRVYGAVVSTSNDTIDPSLRTNHRRPQPRWLLSLLLVLGAALFVAGVAAERHALTHHTEVAAEAVPAGGDGDGGEAPAATRPTAAGSAVAATGGTTARNERVLGVDLESNALVAGAVAVSLALAGMALLGRRRSVAVGAGVLAIAFAAFDVAEIVHQVHESRRSLAVLAASIALVHLAAAATATERARTCLTFEST
jgi:hypothetical protein